MKRFISAVTLVVLFNSCAFSVPTRVFDATVRVINSQGRGTGVVISKVGHILTAGHMVPEGEEQLPITVITRSGDTVAARVLKVDRDKDLALIRVDMKLPINPVSLSAHNAKIDDLVYTIGNPLGITWTITHGRIANWEEVRYLLDITINPGNSGGGLFNDKNELIGICSAEVITNPLLPIPAHLGIFIDTYTIQTFLQDFNLK